MKQFFVGACGFPSVLSFTLFIVYKSLRNRKERYLNSWGKKRQESTSQGALNHMLRRRNKVKKKKPSLKAQGYMEKNEEKKKEKEKKGHS